MDDRVPLEMSVVSCRGMKKLLIKICVVFKDPLIRTLDLRKNLTNMWRR